MACVLLFLRFIISLILGQYYYGKEVRNRRTSLAGLRVEDNDNHVVDERNRSLSTRDAEFINLGKRLYASFHLLYFIGLFRIMPLLEFQYEVGIGYVADILINILPMFLI